MLQISQIEKPRCSATIDQMRLRRAMTLPSAFQNFSSSGFQSAIQRVVSLLIEFSPSPLRGPAFSLGKTKAARRGACASLQSGGVAYVALRWTRGAVCAAPRPHHISSFVPDHEISAFRFDNQMVRSKTPILNKVLPNGFPCP